MPRIASLNPSPKWVPGIRKIAVLRANALGDYIFAQPALYALRAAYPQAELILLGKAWHKAYLKDRPGPVDRVVVVPPYKGVSQPDTWSGQTPEITAVQEQFFKDMQAECFDLALQMHGGGGNSNPFIQRLGAAHTAGMRAPGAPELERWMPYIYWQHEILRLLEVASLVGAPPVMLEPRIETTQRDLDAARQALGPVNKPLVVLHPGASDGRRRWSPQNFAQVGDALAQDGYAVVIVGVADENELAQEVVAGMNSSVRNLCGQLTLSGLTGLLAQAALVIGNDSGPRHLAEAVGAPTVGIYWCGNLINAGSAFRTRHRPHLSWRLDCPVCGQNTITNPCQHEVSFVDDVSVDEVLESARDILKITQAEQARAGER